MASTTKRRFTDEFKREAVALWETSGHLRSEVAAELGIMPTMLRRWQRKFEGSSVPVASPAAKPPVIDDGIARGSGVGDCAVAPRAGAGADGA